MSEALDELEQEAAGLRAEIERLEAIERQLEIAAYEFDHQVRRASDALIRAGGRSSEAEGQMNLLAENKKLTEKDLARRRAELASLRARMTELESEIARLRDG